MMEPSSAAGESRAAECALADVKVLELGSMLAGPFVGTLLAEFGAEVIKAEKPGAFDALRQWPPFKNGEALWWRSMARNKRLITLDISRPEARKIVLLLIERSDVIVENFRPGTLERWNLCPEEMLKVYPHTVWVRVSGYGQQGPYSGRGGYATIAEAYSGLSSFTGFPETGPMVSAFPLGDYLAGTFGAYGAMTALHHRDRTGRGQVVDVSLFEPLFRIIESMVVRYDQTGTKKKRLGNQMEEDIPRNVYATANGGHIAISCGSQKIFDSLMDTIGRPELKHDPRFASMAKRAENRDTIDGIVREWVGSLPTAEAMGCLDAAAVVAGRVYDVEDILTDEHFRFRQAISTLMDPILGKMRMPSPVPKLSQTPGRIRWTGKHPGADNDFVLRDLLRLDDEELARLASAGVI